jgi:hypothetical protein
MCASTDALVTELIHEFIRTQSNMLEQFKKLPSTVDERSYLQSAASLTLQPQSRNLELITSMLAQVTSGPATLTIGDRVLPLPQGVTYWNGLSWFVTYEQVRSITQATVGVLSLELMGHEIPTRGAW